MTEYASRKLAEQFLQFNIISPSEQDNYNYYIQLLIEKSIGIGLMLLISILSRFFFETVCFLTFFSFIRKYSGGYHARNFGECLGLSITLYYCFIKIILPFLIANPMLNTYLLFVAFIIIIAIGAVNHPNIHWDKQEFDMSKRSSRAICVLETSIIITFSLLNVPCSYIYFMSFGMILSATMLVIAKFIKQEVK